MTEERDGGQQVLGADVGADEIVPPGTDIGTPDQAYVPPAIQLAHLRRRQFELRAAA